MKNNVYPLLKLMFPLVLTGLVQSAVWFFETLFLSHLSPEILAAGSLVSWAFDPCFIYSQLSFRGSWVTSVAEKIVSTSINSVLDLCFCK